MVTDINNRQIEPGAKLVVHKPDGKYVWATVIRIEQTVAGPKIVAQSNQLLLKVAPEFCEVVV